MGAYLNLTALVTEDNRLLLQPGFVMTINESVPAVPSTSFGGGELPPIYQEALQGTPVNPDPNDVLTVEVIDTNYTVLSRVQLPLSPLCVEGTPSVKFMTSARIPWVAEATSIRFYRGSQLIHIEDVPTGQPKITLTWAPAEPVVGQHMITWKASHSEGRPLHYIVLYSHTAGRSWSPLSLPLDINRFEVDFDELAGGQGKIAVLASDGINTAPAQSRSFIVPVKPFFTVIQTPQDGEILTPGVLIWLQGQAFNREEERPETGELIWSSSLQGELGRGLQVIADLSEGVHRITLTAGSGERQGQASITVSVRGEPDTGGNSGDSWERDGVERK